MPQQIEIAVVGGGVVGSALALGLAQQGLRVTLIERVTPPVFDALAQPDVRIYALGMASVNLLRWLGVWDTVCNMRTHPYRRVETWEWESAYLKFDASEIKLAQLGYMVENSVLQRALWQALELHPNVTLCVPISLILLRRNEWGYNLTLSNGKELAANLVVGADGANSQVRQMANIGIYAWQYNQSCIMITVKCENNPHYNTWQHFTPNGPRAFLPLFDHWASLVWYDIPARINQLQNLTISQLEREIILNFPARLGKITPVMVDTFQLTRHHALKYVLENLVLVGDAAHTIHPLAGQGINLGYRDVYALLDTISYARIRNEPWTSQMILSRYQHRRMMDNFIMQSGIDLLYALFSNNIRPIRLLRNIGLIVAEHTVMFKRQILKYVLGL